jgi:hypothetical protein
VDNVNYILFLCVTIPLLLMLFLTDRDHRTGLTFMVIGIVLCLIVSELNGFFLRLFGGERMKHVVDRLGVEEDEAIEAGMITRSIENAQKKVEGRNFSARKYVLQYDNVMNKQREIIYGERRRVLFGEDLR